MLVSTSIDGFRPVVCQGRRFFFFTTVQWRIMPTTTALIDFMIASNAYIPAEVLVSAAPSAVAFITSTENLDTTGHLKTSAPIPLPCLLTIRRGKIVHSTRCIYHGSIDGECNAVPSSFFLISRDRSNGPYCNLAYICIVIFLTDTHSEHFSFISCQDTELYML